MRKVKIAVVGSNGHQIIGPMQKVEACQLVGIADCNPDIIAQWEKTSPEFLSKVPRFNSLEEILQKTDCDLVSLCANRRDQQGKQVLSCLKAGRHVLAEKPICTSLEELKEIRAVSQKANRKVWAMLPMIYMPIFRDFEQHVRNGELGEIVQVVAQKSYKFGGNKRPQDRGIDGGITQAAIHAMSFVRSTTGLEFTELSAMECAVGNPQPKGELQTAFAMNAKLSNGALCQIWANYMNPLSVSYWGNDQLRIFGTRGMVEAVDGLGRASLFLPSGSHQKNLDQQQPNYLPDLLQELISNEPSHLEMEDSFRCTQIAIEAQISASQGGVWRKLKF